MSKPTKSLPTDIDRGQEKAESDFLSKWAEKKRNDLRRRASIKEPVYMPDANRHKQFIDQLRFNIDEIQTRCGALDMYLNDNLNKNIVTSIRTITRRMEREMEEFFLDEDLKMPFEEMAYCNPTEKGVT